MKIKITPDQQPAFIKALKKTESVAKSRTSIPVLGGVLITADDNGILLQATNLDQTFEIRVEAEVTENGKVGVSAYDLSRIAAFSKEMALTSDGKHLSIEGNGNFQLPLLIVDDFPPFQKVEDAKAYTLTNAELRNLLKVGYAMETPSGSRYTLQGICLNTEAKESAACNGSSLAMSSVSPSKSGWDSIVPDVACRILGSLISEGGDYAVNINATSASFESGNVVFHTRLIEGSFPNFHSILRPTEFGVKINRKQLIESIERASVAQNDTGRADMKIQGATMTLSVQGKNCDSSVEIDLEKAIKKPSEFSVAFNASFLSNAAKSMEDEGISLEFIDEQSPMFVRGDSFAVIQIMSIK